ncbi:uncharacterized protein N7446_005430 [Penicillium canescens]|uniref:Uncharacterized protein n=1 Tax=Penicillium canescens TaxID=5083 RepID=A0AAD6IJJ8_PENCN|nr:uncharacterized protein N7446_005430 [Penicillium canescens]KAJ6050330.1 hypothetical protein N7444_007046 [Penicillium canescens]KAJ6050806.1 hypothetical protein N7460_001340 [Penicillium canescens]KAJ6061310.1 hypothetical protein N7446_005430 [Penicillium canescens]KAJ6183552.1 hypothetical protein N7485_002194 [Penicillium canescens]
MDFEDMCTEVESLHQKIKFIEKHAESVQRRGLLAEEQARRRAELLEDLIQEVDASRKENNLLATQLASLQAEIKSFSEEDACHSIRRLYHDLRHWSHIAALMFTTFWVRFMVGYGPSWNNYLCGLDQEVRGLYRSHRTSQLSDLIQRCVQLKQSLECQDGAYIFRRSHPRMPFRDENMRSLVEEVGSNDTVEYSVWPGLYQILQPGNWAVVEKEIVKTTSSRIDTLSMTDEPEGRSEEQWLEEI